MMNAYDYCDFDEVDVVLASDDRFDNLFAAASDTTVEEGTVDLIIEEMQRANMIHKSNLMDEDGVSEYNPEEDDAVGILDCVAEDYRNYISDEYDDDEDGEIIDSVMNDTEVDD